MRLLRTMLREGKAAFADIADFNFIAGYTVSLFPYLFGGYKEMEKEGIRWLQRAVELAPDDLVYKMGYLGGIRNADFRQYEEAKLNAAPLVVERFKGAGVLNSYFREVLYRVGG